MTTPVDKVWKIRNKDGLWSNGGSVPSFSKRGKVWNNLGHLKNHLNSMNPRRYDSATGTYYYPNKLPPEDWEIVEIIVNYDESNKSSARELMLAQQRKADLERKHGPCFSELVTRIEAKNEQAQYQWVLVIGERGKYEIQTEFADLIKHHKLKMNVDYKRVTKDAISAYAFKYKTDAMAMRLAFRGNVKGIDIQQYVETDLDIAPA